MAAARWKGRAVAVKVMLASAGDHAGELESFRQEVQVLSGLAHKRIILCWAPAWRRPTSASWRRWPMQAPCSTT